MLEDEATSPPSLLDNESVSEQSDRSTHIDTKIAVGPLRGEGLDGKIQLLFEEGISRTPMKTHVKCCQPTIIVCHFYGCLWGLSCRR